MRKDFWYVGGLVALFLVVVLWSVPSMPTAQAQSTILNGYPSWTCSVDNVAATSTQCGNFPKPDESFYLSWVIAQSTTTTGGQFLIQSGTVAGCASGTTSFIPAAAAVIRLGSAANTAAPSLLVFDPPLQVPRGRLLCVLGKATDTTTLQMGGPVGP